MVIIVGCRLSTMNISHTIVGFVLSMATWWLHAQRQRIIIGLKEVIKPLLGGRTLKILPTGWSLPSPMKTSLVLCLQLLHSLLLLLLPLLQSSMPPLPRKRSTLMTVSGTLRQTCLWHVSPLGKEKNSMTLIIPIRMMLQVFEVLKRTIDNWWSLMSLMPTMTVKSGQMSRRKKEKKASREEHELLVCNFSLVLF